MGEAPCLCPLEKSEILPTTPFEAAELGLVKEVRAWLNSGGDINATTVGDKDNTPVGLTLLAAACCQGTSEVVKRLVTYPNVHLNTRHHLDCVQDCTPLWIAANRGHHHCVNTLLAATSACRIDLSAMALTKEGKSITPIMAATKNRHWDIVASLCDSHTNMSCAEATFIMEEAKKDSHWVTVKKVLDRNFMLPTNTYVALLHKAYECNEWEVVCSVLQQKFRHRIDGICQILSKTVEARDWDRVESVISILDNSLKFEKDLVKAALSENLLDTQQPFLQQKENIRDAIRLAVAAGGTSEEVAPHLFLNQYSCSNKPVAESCLILAAMNGHLEILTTLLRNNSMLKHYSVLSRAREAAAQEEHQDIVRFLDVVLQKYANSY